MSKKHTGVERDEMFSKFTCGKLKQEEKLSELIANASLTFNLQRIRRFPKRRPVMGSRDLCRGEPFGTFSSCVCVMQIGSVVGPCESLGFRVLLWGEIVRFCDVDLGPIAGVLNSVS